MLPDASRSYMKPSLIASLVTAAGTQIAFMCDLYIGSPYGPNFEALFPSIILSPIVTIPGMLFGLFFVWPVALSMAHVADWVIVRWMPRLDWLIWLLLGAASGPVALFAYAYLLRLGQSLLVSLIANGMVCGMACAAILRALAKPDVGWSTSGAQDEQPNDVT